MRGYLAFFVFIHHFTIWRRYLKEGVWVMPESHFLSHCGSAAVAFFFLITGFLFFNKLFEEQEIDWQEFYQKRIFRLFPLYLFSITILFFFVAIESGFKLQEPVGNVFSEVRQWLVFTYFGYQDINKVPNTVLINAGVVWSLCYEWLFYLSLPLIHLFLFRRKTSLVTLVFCFIGCRYFFLFFYRPEYALLGYFLGGGLAALLIQKIKVIPFITSSGASILAIFLVALNVILYKHAESIYSVYFLTPVFIIVAYGNDFWGILSAKVSQLFGQLSYSIYLLHGLVLFLFNHLLLHKKWLLQLSENEYGLLGIVYVFFIVLLSFWGHNNIERRFMKRKKQIAR